MTNAAFTFEQVLNWTGAKHLLGRKAEPFEGVSIDSRKTQKGEIFFSIRGPRFDGNNFILEAVQRGATGVVVSRVPETSVFDPLRRQGIAVALVEDGVKTLQVLAQNYRKQFSIPVIGVTGSCGKTTTKEIIHSFLEELGPSLKNEGTLNNHIGLPLTLLGLRNYHRSCSLEMGTSSPGEIAHLVSLAGPTMGVLLNIGAAHLKMLGSLDGVLEEKSALMKGVGSGVCVYNMDDPLLKKSSSTWAGPLVSFGIYSGGQFQAARIEFYRNHSIRFMLLFEGQELGMVKIPVLGVHNVYNVLAAMAVGHTLGVSLEAMIEKAASLTLPPMRWEVSKLNGLTVINDAYNANPQSMNSALETFKLLRVDGRKIFVCGDMLDLGDEERYWHRTLSQAVVDSGVDFLVTVGPLAALVAQAAREKGFSKGAAFTCEDHVQALACLSEIMSDTDAILVKGSRLMGMEKIVEGLIKKCSITSSIH